MQEFFNSLVEIISKINGPVAAILIIVILRRPVNQLLSALTQKIGRPGEVVIGPNGVSIKEYIEKKLDEKQDETLSMLESGEGKPASLIKFDGFIGKVQPFAMDNAAFDNGFVPDAAKEPIKPENPDPLNAIEGKPEKNNRKLSAEVLPVKGSNLYKIKLTVVSTSKTDPLKGTVKFMLHPSFVKSERIVDVIQGKAELSLVSYGSFTLLAETDAGKTQLRLDLATDVPGVSEHFKTN